MKYFTRTEYDLLFDHDGEIQGERYPPRKAAQWLLQYALVITIAIASFIAGRLSLFRLNSPEEAWSLWNDFCEWTFAQYH
jgi:hypothetical protein